MGKITPCLWFDHEGEEAANFYISVFKNSEILDATRYGEAGPGTPGTVVSVLFSLDGQKFVAINGGPMFTFSEAISFQIDCQDQAEVDHYWNALTEGGEEGQCAWLKDRYGVSWQVVPSRLTELLSDSDPGRVKRATEAMLSMKKIDIDALERAVASS